MDAQRRLWRPRVRIRRQREELAQQEFELLIANREKVLPWIKEYSPIELVSTDDPPIYLDFPRQEYAAERGPTAGRSRRTRQSTASSWRKS